MASRSREVEITGVKELEKMARKVAPRTARNLARGTVHYVAGQVRNGMRQKAPKDEGDLRRAIKTQRRKMRGYMAISDVRISHGKGIRFDAFYWHFEEFGTRQKAAVPYIRPTVEEYTSQIPGIYRREFGRRLERQLEKDAAKMGVK